MMGLGIGPHDDGCECDRCEGRRAANAQELLQDVALKLDLANMELRTIDEVLARRPALAGLKHRTEKIERACNVNGELLAALKAVLPNLEWANIHGSRCEEVIKMVFNLAWAESLLEQCRAAGVPFFMKQIGSHPIMAHDNHFKITNSKGGEMWEWPEHLRVREFPAERTVSA
jgi:hypothetical protein